MRDSLGKILKIDLSRRKILTVPLTREMRRKFIGGRGLNAKILLDEVPPQTDAFHPENRLIFGCGPLTGTLAPGSCRFNVTCRSPLGYLGDSNCGDFWAPELAFAGFDHIVLSGKAEKPTYLLINDKEVELKDAAHLWSKNTRDTRNVIRKDNSDNKIQIASIGPGGENLVRFANISTSIASFAGRTGCGAVMGSKNIKAIAVRGTEGVTIADLDRFVKITRTMLEGIKESGSLTETYYRIYYLHQNNSMMVTKHHQQAWWEDADRLDPQFFYDKYVTETWSNFCPGQNQLGQGCQPIYKITEGPYKGTYGSLEYEGIAAMGAAVANTNLESVLRANELVDNYGVDVGSCGRVISFAMELFQRGIINEDDIGFPLKWGDGAAVIKMIDMIVKRQGLGNLLAEGEARAGKLIGKGAEDYVLVIKGLEQHETGRANRGLALAQATSTRGSDHLRGDPPEGGFYKGTSDIIERVFGIRASEISPRQYEWKAEMVRVSQIHSMLADSLEICKRFSLGSFSIYSRIKDNPPGSLYAGLFSSATGVEMEAHELLKAAERCYNVERAFIAREGARREDDFQTWRDYRDPLPNGPHKGEILDREKYGRMLDRYYELWGWDVKTGIPTKKTLSELGLKDVARHLHKQGILPEETLRK